MGNAQVRRIQKRVIYFQINLILSFRINEDSVSGNAALDVDGTQQPNTFIPLQRILRQ